MRVVVIDIKCEKCSYEFKSYLNGIPLAGVDYLSICPKCNNETLFSNKAGFIEASKPENAVEIKVI